MSAIPQVTAATPAAAGATPKAPAPENPAGQLGQNDFLKLMIAQLQAQNPLEPSNGNEYVTELAQFTQLEQTTNLASAGELSSAVQLIGHTVSYSDPTTGATSTGVVESVQSATSGPTVTVEGVTGIKLSSVTQVN